MTGWNYWVNNYLTDEDPACSTFWVADPHGTCFNVDLTLHHVQVVRPLSQRHTGIERIKLSELLSVLIHQNSGGHSHHHLTH